MLMLRTMGMSNNKNRVTYKDIIYGLFTGIMFFLLGALFDNLVSPLLQSII